MSVCWPGKEDLKKKEKCREIKRVCSLMQCMPAWLGGWRACWHGSRGPVRRGWVMSRQSHITGPLWTRGNCGEPTEQPIHGITRFIRPWHKHTRPFFSPLLLVICVTCGVEGFRGSVWVLNRDVVEGKPIRTHWKDLFVQKIELIYNREYKWIVNRFVFSIGC